MLEPAPACQPCTCAAVLSDAQIYALSDAHMRGPIALVEANLGKPFVYLRGYGVFDVPFGHHQAAMSLLLAFQHGLTCGIDVASKLNLDYADETADHWLEHTIGAAFKSSVGKSVMAGKFKHLSIAERRFFGTVSYLFD